MKTLVPAKMDELAICYAIIDEGRTFQKEQGFVQWTDDYPNMDTIRDDIQDQKGFVIKDNGVIAGYMCIDLDGEPAYINIDGQWAAEEPYAVVHRMAFSRDFRGTGLADEAFRLIGEFCTSRGVDYIRVDTDFPNKRMQHILEKNGFTRRGTVIFQGSGKIAYDKILTDGDLAGSGIVMALEPAGEKDFGTCWHMIEEGRRFQQDQGFVQWTEDYPCQKNIRDDIERQKGYLIKIGGRTAGYVCIDFDGEPAYEGLHGKWGADRPYAVVNRLAFSSSFRGKGHTDSLFGLIEKLCAEKGVFNIRLNTYAENEKMRHIIEKNGFTRRGTVDFRGGEKIAYDKTI